MSEDDQLTSELASLKINHDLRDDAPVETRRRSGNQSGVGGVVLVVLVLGVCGALGYLLYDRAKDRLFVKDVELTQVSLVSPSQGEVTLVATGYVVSRRKATVSARVAGRIARLLVKEGDRIVEGQTVAELEHADIEAQLGQVHADLATSRARVEQVKADLADAERRAHREAELLGKGAGTTATSDDAAARVTTVKAQLAETLAEVMAAEARARITDVTLGYTKVKAPFNATVLRKLAEVGDMVSPAPSGGAVGSGGIINIAALDQMEVETDVSETQLGKILPATSRDEKSGEELPAPALATPAEIVLDAFPDRRFRGQLTEIRPTVDRAKATVTAKVRFVDKAEGVLPDMSAKVSFLAKPINPTKLAEAAKRVLPADAVVERAGKKVALTVDNGVARSVAVTVKGPLGTGQLEISDGPSVGVQVIRNPTPEIVDGVHVKQAEH